MFYSNKDRIPDHPVKGKRLRRIYDALDRTDKNAKMIMTKTKMMDTEQ